MMITTGGDGDVATRRLFHIVLAVFGLSLLLIPLDPVYSSTVDVGGVGFEARVGFSDRFRPGTWVPVWIHVTNAGIPFDAHIEVITTAGNPYSSRQTRVVYRRPVRLPSGTRKQFTFNIPLTNTAVPIDVRLVELNGNILSNRRISLRESAITSDIVLILDTTGEKWTWLHEVVPTTRSFSPQTRVYVAHARSETDLPTEWVAYESIRTVILTPSFPIASLAPEQITALVDWIKAGGHLLVAGGPGLDLVSVSELADRLPVALSTLRGGHPGRDGLQRASFACSTPVLATLARLVREGRPGRRRYTAHRPLLRRNGPDYLHRLRSRSGTIAHLGSLRLLQSILGLSSAHGPPIHGFLGTAVSSFGKCAKGSLSPTSVVVHLLLRLRFGHRRQSAPGYKASGRLARIDSCNRCRHLVCAGGDQHTDQKGHEGLCRSARLARRSGVNGSVQCRFCWSGRHARWRLGLFTRRRYAHRPGRSVRLRRSAAFGG